MSPRIPHLQVSDHLWGLMGPALYSERPMLPITARELWQNAHDATTPENRAITIILHSTADFTTSNLVITDNGWGMDENTLLDKFLCLGATGKDTGIGGWGLAKAAIIGACHDWHLATNQLILHKQNITHKQPLTTRPFKPGTTITLDYHFHPHTPEPQQLALQWTTAAVATTISYLAHSDTTGTIHWHQESSPHHEPLHQTYTLAPLTLPPPLHTGTAPGYTWRLYQCTPLNLPRLQLYATNYSGNTYPRIIPSGHRAVWRLNGLVQTMNYVDHADLWIIDLTTTTRPGDPEYPLTPSRERVTGDLFQKIDALIREHELNSLSSAHLKQEREHQETQPSTDLYLTGDFVDHTTIATATLPPTSLPASPNPSSTPLHRRYSSLTVPPPAKQLTTQASPLGIKTLIRGAHLTQAHFTAAKNLKILAAWLEILTQMHHLASIPERWGIGFTYYNYHDAERYTITQTTGTEVYYLLNPRTSGIKLSHPQATLLLMLYLAAHELAHEQHPNHTEQFTAREWQLYQMAVQQLPRFKKARHILAGHPLAPPPPSSQARLL